MDLTKQIGGSCFAHTICVGSQYDLNMIWRWLCFTASRRPRTRSLISYIAHIRRNRDRYKDIETHYLFRLLPYTITLYHNSYISSTISEQNHKYFLGIYYSFAILITLTRLHFLWWLLCVHTDAYTYRCVSTYTYACAPTYERVRLRIYERACVMRMRLCTYTCIHTYACMPVYMRMCMRVIIRVCVYMRACAWYNILI